MAIGWLAVLQAVPWGQVIDNAPKVVDGAKKFWGSVSKKPAAEEFDVSDAQASAEDVEDLDIIQKRLAALETKTAELHEQMVTSSALIRELADQNTQLIARIEANRIRTVWLTVLCVVSILAALASLVLVFSYHAT